MPGYDNVTGTEDTSNMQIQLEASNDKRMGNYANFFTVSNGERISILDCFCIDIVLESEEGELRRGILTSRILMDASSVIKLRDALSEHIDRCGWDSVDV